jgi:hypothetical protein
MFAGRFTRWLAGSQSPDAWCCAPAGLTNHWQRDLWVTEFILTYDGKPSYTVSITEFKGDKVARETQYFADPFVAPAWRDQWAERMDT